MLEMLVAKLQADFAACEEQYKQFDDVDSVGKKEWLASLNTEQHEEAVSDLLEGVKDAATATEDPSYLAAIYDGLSDLLGDVRQWLTSEHNKATGRQVPTGSAEQLETMVKEFRKTFDSALQMSKQMPELIPAEAILGAVRTKERGVKNGTKIVPDLKTVKVKSRNVARVGESSTKVRLVWNTDVMVDDNLGIQCKRAGITMAQLSKALEAAYPDVKNPWNKAELYNDHMVQIGNDWFGLRMVR